MAESGAYRCAVMEVMALSDEAYTETRPEAGVPSLPAPYSTGATAACAAGTGPSRTPAATKAQASARDRFLT